MKPFRYFVPTEIVFDAGCLDTLSIQAARYGSKALVVTGRESAQASGSLTRALSQLPGAVVFGEVDENPTTGVCESGAEVCREAGCDFIVALGGGSAMDAGKAIAVLARNAGPCSRFFGADKYSEPNLPVLAVPTTAGTGSEVTPYSVITDTDTASKRTIAGRTLFPVVALLDPELSVTMPRDVTVNTGLDALSQVMEGMVSAKSTPVGDVLALETCGIIRQWLPRAAGQPDDLEARAQMLYASMISGCVIAQSGTTLVHGMGYQYTLRYGLAHGLANALLLAPLFQRNARLMPATVSQIADRLGAPGGSEPGEASDRIGKAICAFLEELKVSPSARDWGVKRGDLELMAEAIWRDEGRMKNEPEKPDRQELLRLYEQSFEGVLV